MAVDAAKSTSTTQACHPPNNIGFQLVNLLWIKTIQLPNIPNTFFYPNTLIIHWDNSILPTLTPQTQNTIRLITYVFDLTQNNINRSLRSLLIQDVRQRSMTWWNRSQFRIDGPTLWYLWQRGWHSWQNGTQCCLWQLHSHSHYQSFIHWATKLWLQSRWSSNTELPHLEHFTLTHG